MEHHLSQRTGILSLLLLAVAAWGADEQPNAANRALGFIPWIGNNGLYSVDRQ
jgi:hypothetical protein